MAKKNIYLWNKSIVGATILPTLWFSAKTYHEDYGKTTDQWSWQDPFIHLKTSDQILEQCESNPPTIFGFSVYIWNYIDADALAKEIKKRYPKCLVIYGGPQIDIKYSNNFFIKTPWVDLVVPSDVYGEPLITHILDNFDDLKIHEIPEVYYHRGGIKLRSKVPFVKRTFTWPSNIFEKQKDYLNFADGHSTVVIYETTRGCPYGCTYCDWGGGTFTKVVRKPMATILSELEFLSKLKVKTIIFADANFGIYKDDINIIEHIVNLREKYGYPDQISVENAKNNLDRVIAIQRLLVKNQLSYYYKISIQSIHDDIKTNIDRVDIPFEEQLTAIFKLREEFNAPVLIETIMGLPGDNYERTLASIDLFQRNGIESHRPAIWNLLPEAPAFDPVYREKFQLETQNFEIITHPFRYKNPEDIEEGVVTLQLGRPMIVENVISTYSYSKYEWCDMIAVTTFAGLSNSLGFNFITNYLEEEHNLTPSSFYDKMYKDIIFKKKFYSDILNDKIGGITDKLKELVDGKADRLNFDVDPEFPLYLSPFTYTSFIIMLYPKEFFIPVTEYFADWLGDDKIKDLGIYLANIMIDIDFDPKHPRTFQTEYNWYSHFNDKKLLLKSKYEYIINDKQLKFVSSKNFDYSDYPTIKDRNQKMKQFFYHRASNAARKKYAEHIIENEVFQTTK